MARKSTAKKLPPVSIIDGAIVIAPLPIVTIERVVHFIAAIATIVYALTH
jgi:hypothetical protein